ncbi:MAG: hypothetical protein INR71_14540, partial [Terriglobus roseus]|nr:hypothetical protein [Terriglobus roseus]
MASDATAADQRPPPAQDGARAPVAAPPIPPSMASSKATTVDELIADMNRMPLFMTTLDETDGADGDNAALT